MTSNDVLSYAAELFAAEDDALTAARLAHEQEGLPAIQISADEGRVLQVLLYAVAARRVLEVGTLGGYSGIWIARALPTDGLLTTIEVDGRHAEVARRAFARAEVQDKIRLLEGRALDLLPDFADGEFDAVFVDADKEPLPEYYHHAMRVLRRGGLLLCDNAFFHERVVDRSDTRPDVEGVREFNRRAASDPRLVATALPVRDGLIAGIKVAD